MINPLNEQSEEEMVNPAMEIGYGMVRVALTGKMTATTKVEPNFVLTLGSCVCSALFAILQRSVSVTEDEYEILSWRPGIRLLTVMMKKTADQIPGGI